MSISSLGSYYQSSTVRSIDRIKPAAKELQIASVSKLKTAGLTPSVAADTTPTAPNPPKNPKVQKAATQIDVVAGPVTPLYPNAPAQVRSMIMQLRGLAEKAASGNLTDADRSQMQQTFNKLFGGMMSLFGAPASVQSAESLSLDSRSPRDPMKMIFRSLSENGLVNGARPNIMSDEGAKQAYSSLGNVLSFIDSMKFDVGNPTLSGPFPAIPGAPEYPVTPTLGDPVLTATPGPTIPLGNNNPGGLDPALFDEMLRRFRAGDMSADIDGSGALSPADFVAFLAAFRAGKNPFEVDPSTGTGGVKSSPTAEAYNNNGAAVDSANARLTNKLLDVLG